MHNNYHINCSGCHKSDKDTLIGKQEKCRWCEGTGKVHEDNEGYITLGIGEPCQSCFGEGKQEYIPRASYHHWARTDAYGIYTGLYCDKCYKDNYPYRRDRYHDESYCGERMEPDE